MKRKRIKFSGSFLLPEGWDGGWREAFEAMQDHALSKLVEVEKGQWPDEKERPLRVQQYPIEEFDDDDPSGDYSIGA